MCFFLVIGNEGLGYMCLALGIGFCGFSIVGSFFRVFFFYGWEIEVWRLSDLFRWLAGRRDLVRFVGG